jgi:hypothetical protein
MEEFLTFEIKVSTRDTRRILIVKSHNQPLSDATSEVIAKLAPSDLYRVVTPIEEATVLVGTDTKRCTYKNVEEKIRAAMADFSDMDRRVYNSLSWNIRRKPELWAGDWRVIYIPHGNTTIGVMVVCALQGIFGRLPELVNQISHAGELIPVAELPLIDLDKVKQSGRKLRDLADNLLREQEESPRPANRGRDIMKSEETHTS